MKVGDVVELRGQEMGPAMVVVWVKDGAADLAWFTNTEHLRTAQAVPFACLVPVGLDDAVAADRFDMSIGNAK